MDNCEPCSDVIDGRGNKKHHTPDADGKTSGKRWQNQNIQGCEYEPDHSREGDFLYSTWLKQ